MTVRGSNSRFILGSFTNESAGTLWEMSSEKVEYSVIDQNSDKYITKIGNRYTNIYELFDFTEAQKTTLLGYNATTQTFVQNFDTENSKLVYCDVYFNELKYYPKSCIQIILTDVLITDETSTSYTDSTRSEYTGYYHFAAGDYIEFPFTELSDDPAWNGDFTIAFEYDPDDVARPDNEYLICSYYTNNYLFRIYTFAGKLIVSQVNATVPGQTTLSVISTSTLPTTAGKIKIIITRDFAPHASDVKIYFDNVDDSATVTTNTLDTPTFDTGEPVLFGKYDYATPLYMDARKISNIFFSDTIWSSADRLNYQNNNYDAITGLYAKNLCNEDVPYGSSPYVGVSIDSSGNAQDATVYCADKSTFFNFIMLYGWYTQDNIQFNTPYSKITMSGEADYIFDSSDSKATALIEYKIENDIDWEETSITGKLHRNYTIGADGTTIKQNISYKITKFNLERADYNLLKVYDGGDIEFYPNSDEAEYFNASCSMVFLNHDNFINCDMVEIEITCRGARLT